MTPELEAALRVLVAVHTRDGDETCHFAIITGVTPSTPGADRQGYVDAWRTIRRNVGKAG